VKDDGFANLSLDFNDSRAGSNAARKIGDIRRVVTCGFLNDYGVAYRTSRLRTSLLLNIVQCAKRQIIARLAGNSDATKLARVLELAMTSTRYNQVLTIDLEHSQDFTDLH
jgi:hypothetical protein